MRGGEGIASLRNQIGQFRVGEKRPHPGNERFDGQVADEQADKKRKQHGDPAQTGLPAHQTQRRKDKPDHAAISQMGDEQHDRRQEIPAHVLDNCGQNLIIKGLDELHTVLLTKELAQEENPCHNRLNYRLFHRVIQPEIFQKERKNKKYLRAPLTDGKRLDKLYAVFVKCDELV